jgi:hypothetical protein
MRPSLMGLAFLLAPALTLATGPETKPKKTFSASEELSDVTSVGHCNAGNFPPAVATLENTVDLRAEATDVAARRYCESTPKLESKWAMRVTCLGNGHMQRDVWAEFSCLPKGRQPIVEHRVPFYGGATWDLSLGQVPPATIHKVVGTLHEFNNTPDTVMQPGDWSQLWADYNSKAQAACEGGNPQRITAWSFQTVMFKKDGEPNKVAFDLIVKAQFDCGPGSAQ